MKDLISAAQPTQALADELKILREKLEIETNAVKQREENSLEFRIDLIRAEIADKERRLDEIQGREAEENRRQQQDFERTSERLAESQAEIARLRTEYCALPEKIRVAEWHFHKALRESLTKQHKNQSLSGKSTGREKVDSIV
jgi:hypothetical protein